jgi:hypothetical protein
LWEKHRLRVFVNRVLKKIFGPERDEIRGKKRRLYDEELYDLYPSLNTIRMIKLGKMRLGGHLALLGRRDMHTGFWWENPRKKYHLKDERINGRIILKYIFNKWDRGHGLDWSDTV